MLAYILGLVFVNARHEVSLQTYKYKSRQHV